MSRRHKAIKSSMSTDPKFNSELVARIINCIMRRGKKTVAEGIVYGALDEIKEKMGEDPLEVLIKAVDNVKPKVEVKSRRVGGATYQVPVEVNRLRGMALAIRWMVEHSSGRKGVPMKKALSTEIMEAFKGQGEAIKKRDDTHKMAQANRAFAHYAW
jgi:small subunit ribosomal protein S7